VDLLEGGVDALALVVGDVLGGDVVLPGRDLIGEFTEGRFLAVVLEVVKRVAAPVVAQ
jgi:hypothetical protein